MSGVRPAARLARREVARRPGRSLLVALLVAAPVAAMLVASVLVRTEHVSTLEWWSSMNGRADVVIGRGNGPTAARPESALVRTLLSNHSVAVETQVPGQEVTTADGHSAASTFAIVPMDEPITQGMFVVTAGRGVSAPDELFLTRTVARRLHAHVGQDLTLTAPTRGTFRVVGVGEEAAQFGLSEIVLPRNSPWNPRLHGLVSWLVEKPSGVSTTALEQFATATDRSESAPYTMEIAPRLVPVDNSFVAADAETKVRWSWVFGAVALTVTGIVIAAAFAVGARRQLATLGLLSSNGASPRLLYLVLVMQGMWAGAVGAALGVGLGAGVLAVVRPHVEEIFGHAVGPYVFRGTDLIPILVLGVVAATVAAAVPARTATRVPVLAALAGRRPLGRVPVGLSVAGVGAVVVGLATFTRAVDDSNHGFTSGNSLLAMAIAGCVLVLLGGCGIAAGLVGVLEPTAARAVGALQVACRSLARQRTRTAAVVAAVAATGAMAIAGSALVLGQHAAHVHKASSIAPDEVAVSGEYVADGSLPPSAALVERVERVVPDAERIRTRVVADTATLVVSIGVVSPSNDFEWGAYVGVRSAPSITVADPATTALWRLSESDQRALARNGWLVFGASHGQIEFTVGTRTPDDPTVTMRATIARVHAELLPGLDHQTAPSFVITPARAAQLGLETRQSSVVLKSATVLTSAQRAAINAIPDSTSLVSVYTPPARVDPFLGEWVLVGIALALVLFVIATNLGLSAAESRDERDVLTIVGAAPSAMSRTSGYKAVILTVMGALLAIPIGFLPVAIYVHASPGVIPLVFPWRLVTLLVLAVPLVGGLIVTAGSAAALRLRPVHISTMAYD